MDVFRNTIKIEIDNTPYTVSFIIQIIIKIINWFIKNKPISGLIEELPGGTKVAVHLDKIDNLQEDKGQKIFDKLTINNISFEEESVIVDFSYLPKAIK